MNTDPAMVAAEKIIEAFPVLRGQMLHGMPTIIRDAYAETWAAKDAEIRDQVIAKRVIEDDRDETLSQLHHVGQDRDRLSAEIERLKAALAHCHENTREPGVADSCAGLALENERLRKQVAELSRDAERYRAVHPADDDESVSSEWLESVGGLKSRADSYTWVFPFIVDDG